MLACCLWAPIAMAGPITWQSPSENQSSKDKAPQVSEAEQKVLDKIKNSNGADAKLKASGEFVKKYAKSPMRPQVASYLAGEIGAVKDDAQKISLAQNFISTFNQPEEADLVRSYMVEAYLNSGKLDDAINVSSKSPDDITVLVALGWGGANLAQKQAASPKLLQAALPAAAKAVELMETDKKPAAMTAENWASYRNSWLPRLYQAQGVMMFFGNDKPGAKEKLEKAVGFDPYNASTLMVLVTLSDDEYQDLAKRYQAEKKQALLDQALAKLDEVIDWLARAVAVTEGEQQYQAAHQQLADSLKQYYAFRHEGKTDGMTDLVKKYKKTP